MVQHLNAPISLESLNITCRAIFEQLDQVNARITASEELRTASEKLRIASEERIAASTVMSEKLRIASEERIAATAEQITASTARANAAHIRLRAMDQNHQCKMHDFRVYRMLPDVRLAPLVDLRTGEEIAGFPTTAEELSQLDDNQAHLILEALEASNPDFDGPAMRKKILWLTAYA